LALVIGVFAFCFAASHESGQAQDSAMTAAMSGIIGGFLLLALAYALNKRGAGRTGGASAAADRDGDAAAGQRSGRPKEQKVDLGACRRNGAVGANLAGPDPTVL